VPFFSVVIEGAHFPACVFEVSDGPMGFYTTRFVEAVDEKAAELAAVELIKRELKPLLGEQQVGEVNPLMSLDRISELQKLPTTAPGSGFTWFPMND
jgi:hypothetical protein